MPIQPFGSEWITVKKNPNCENRDRFSTGKSEERILAWDVKNSRIKAKSPVYAKVYGEKTQVVLQTYNKLALELETDDYATWEGKNYLVQSVQPKDVPLGIEKKLYEIALG